MDNDNLEIHVFPFTCNYEGSVDNSEYLNVDDEMLVHGRRMRSKRYLIDNFKVIEWSTALSKDIIPDIITFKQACRELNQ